MQGTGTFEVALQPLEPFAAGGTDNSLGRMSIEKRFRGDLEAASLGEMLTARTAVEGSAGYVAVELVAGKLAGREGTFVLQHFGIMDRGENRLLLEVVPDSGSGELAGLSGTMAIEIVDGEHRYTLDYEL